MLPPEAEQLPQAFVENARLLAQRNLLLDLLPKNAVITEVGVGLGDFSRLILDVCKPSTFIAIDEFQLHELTTLWGRPTSEIFGGLTHEEAYRKRFHKEIDAGTVVVMCGDSSQQLEKLKDQTLSMAYIDADHTYELVRRDLDAALPKMAPDSWLIVNDYIMVTELQAQISYGVVHAANEFMLRNNWGISHFALQTRMFCDVAMRPNERLQTERAEATNKAALGQAILQSTSWKITAPLRLLSRLRAAAFKGRSRVRD